MIGWRRALAASTCGYDRSHTIPSGEPYLVITIGTRTFRRCRGCAKRQYEREPPADLPLPMPATVKPTMKAPQGFGRLFNGQATGREPGEDDE